MDVQSFAVFFGLLFAGFIFFCIYFIFKILQFVIQAIDLYKDMVVRQDMTIKLLKDIRDSTENRLDSDSNQNPGKQILFCTKCGEKNIENTENCTSCGAKIIY